MQLLELIQRSGIRGIVGSPAAHVATNTEILEITDDSRRAGPGVLYCATRNGRKFIEPAAAAGSILLLSPSMNAPANALVLRVASPDRAMARLSAALNAHPSKEMCVVAVTGTNGKTTTTHMLYHLWKKAGLPCALVGTLGLRYFDGEVEVSRETGFTTPRSYELQAILRELLDRGIRHVTIEASSEALSLGRLEALTISGVLFTGLGRDHLDHHRTLASYMRAKRHLFFLAARTKAFFSVYAEDEALHSLRRFAERPCIASRLALPGNTSSSFSLLSAIEFESEITARQPVPTGFNRINAALALFAFERTAGRFASASRTEPHVNGLDLADFSGVPGRMQRLRVSDAIDAFVDYAHSPDSLERVLVEARSIGYNTIIVVFGCGGDRDPGKRPLMGEIAARLADLTIVTDDNPRTEAAASIRAQVLTGVAERAGDLLRPALEIGNRAEAIKAALAHARQISVESPARRIAVIVAGKGHETYQIIGREKMHFSDVEEIEQEIERASRSA
jgi:UDP-N-acetylmuramoyl-L-alanyl-D-glutamate--2,6-diaminopimelate ligase